MMKQLNPLRYLFLTCIGLFSINPVVFCQQWDPNYSIGTVTGKYVFNYNQVPDQLIEIVSPVYTATTLSYQWESSSSPGFETFSVLGNQSNYSFPPPPSGCLAQTTYYRRKVIKTSGDYVYSNIIKLQLASINWENLNYIREHDVITTGINTDWKAVDQLTVGQKLQTTTYLDGLGRPIEKVSRETATPSSGTLWGDMVQFSQYDVYGREPKQYLPYTIQYTTATNTESGKYKTTPTTAQSQYYASVYNETFPYSNITFDGSPLNRVGNIKSPGTSWANAAGNSATYDVNSVNDNVQIFTIGYNSGDIPQSLDAYPAKTLFETTKTDENGYRVVEYTNKSGQLVLKKVEIGDAPTVAHSEWICTYYVYDDFGLLRYVLQPEAVKYLDANAWSFAGTFGQRILDEMCFRYEYDDKGRTILKKAPGAQPLQMIYDSRDRVVFMRDGNQAAKATPEWTTNLYDELDRVVITTLYNTSKSIANLQTDINNAVDISTVTIANSGGPIIDLVVDTREPGISTYSASNSITFTADAGGSFASFDNDNFVAQIDATAVTPVITTTVALFDNPILASDLNNSSVTTILKYQYYDNYSFTSVKSFDNNFDNTTAYSNSDPNVIPIASSKRTLSYPTGSLVRVLGTNTFLASTEYYDEKGRHIQMIEDNIKGGQDVTTFQYHFDGRLLSAHSRHSTDYSGYSNFSILTKNLFDKIGRITSIQKKYATNAFKTITTYDYDDMGRLKTKHLDPGYTGSGKNEMEALTYSYNIHNEITGINKDYARKTSGKYDKWGNFFGLYIGYDDNTIFANKQLDGHVTGLLWNTQGDDAQRKYDYTYDKAGRLTSAIFKEKQNPNDIWDNSKMDFPITGSSGKITYDLNGNLLSMLQKGVLPGTSAPVEIDNLAYTYTAYTNKLIKVTDGTAQTATNGQSGDFKDGTNSNNDYVYDDNGNMTTDNNKKINGITYNFLDKPELIPITGKGTIKIVYDAEGNKLQKIFTPQTGTAITTTYINEFVYQGDALQYINFEEGRIRVMTPVSQGNGYDALTIDGNMTLPNGKEGVYDFFIRDYQENVRVILTEEIHTGSNQCTMETARAGTEEPIFGQVDASGQVTANNEVVKTRFAVTDIPGQTSGGGWQNANIGNYVSRLGNLPASKTGPNVLLKVMAGDVINATTQYFYKNTVTNTAGTTSLPQDILNSLLQAILGSSSTTGLVKGGATNISSQLSGNGSFTSITEPDASNATGNNPKAYLTIIFFDERFNYVSTGSAFTRVPINTAGSSNLSLTLPNVKAPKNGYAYVYISNESNEPVYFDNFHVGLNRGRIIEEDHYYAYGLKIAGISSQKLGDVNEGYLDNKNLYNDKELFDDADLDWYDYGFRNYDAQIGRFTQLDPLTFNYPHYTPYQYAGNEPIANVDLDGLEPSTVISEAQNIANGFTMASRNLSEVILPAVPSKVITNAYRNVATMVAENAAKLGIGALRSSIPSGPKPPLPIKPKPQPQLLPSSSRQTYLSPASQLFQWQKDANSIKQKDDRLNLGLDPETGKRPFDFSNLDKANDNLVEPLVYGALMETGAGEVEEVLSLLRGSTQIGSRALFSGAGTEKRAIEAGYSTLSQTRAGQNLMKLTEGMPYYPGSQAYKMWGRISKVWVQGASGEVPIFQNGTMPLRSVLSEYEFPELLKNPNVTNIKFN